MRKLISWSALALSLVGAALPATVHAQENEELSVVMVTDVGGVDDKSFNQSAWEGLVAWGEEHGRERGVNGYEYIQSDSDSDFITNYNSAIQANFDIIVGVGFKLEQTTTEMADQYPDRKFVIIDAFVDKDNVASLNYRDHEAAFLAGVAAAKTTKTNHIGFVGGVEGVIIDRFEAGFVAGARAVNPDIEITIDYAGSFGDASRGKQIASAMYANGADIIFHAAGDTGNGVFSEAKDLVTADPSREIYVIGVDRDQDEEGIVTIDGEERHLTLTSTLKQVGQTLKLFLEETEANGFQAGSLVYGLSDEGVGLTEGQLSDEVLETIEEYKEKIIAGEIEIPETPER